MTSKKRRYLNTGSTPFRGHAPGDEFVASLTADEERRAIARGSIRVVEASKTSSRKADDGEGDST